MAPPTDYLEPEERDSSQWQRSIDWFGMAWRRKSLLGLGLAVGLVVATFVYLQRTPVYQSNAQIMVIRKLGSALPTSGVDPRMAFYEDYLSSHLVLIRSPLIVQRAVQKYHLDVLPSFNGQGNPTESIRGSINPTRDVTAGNAGVTTNIINLSYRSTVSEDNPRVLNAVIDSYKDFLDELFRNVSDETLNQISRAAESLRTDLAQKESAYREFRRNNPEFYWRGMEGSNVHEDWVAQIQTKRLGATIRRAEIQGRLASLEQAIKDGRGRQTLLAQMAVTNANGGSERRLDEQLFELQLREQTLLTDYGPDHPEVVAVRKRIALTRDFFSRSPEKERDGAKENDSVQWYLQSLRQELHDVEFALKSLTELATSEQTQARAIAKLKEEDKHFSEEIARARQSFDPIIKRLDEIKLAREMGGYDARVIAPAGNGYQVAPVASQIFLMWGMGGLLGGLGLAYLAEVTDKSFRTPEEIRRRLGLPVVGHIPLLTPAAEEAAEAKTSGILFDPILCAYYRARSSQAEAFRGIRTALYFSTQGEGHKVIQITSPNPSDGKSTVTANLAISIAQSGKKILLIDCDFRKPVQQKLLGVTADSGLAAVIAGQTKLQDAIYPTEVPDLSLLPCGSRPENPAELLTSPQFKEMIEQVRGDYDYVLIDTPPLLAVSDPSVVAPRVDGVILTIRIKKNARASAERAREILHSLGARVLGVVVNGVGGGAPGYGASEYNYTYGYSYTYHDAYYEDTEEETSRNQEPGTFSRAGSSEDAIGEAPPPHTNRSGRPGSNSFKIRHRQAKPVKPSLFARLFPWWRS